jgi:hypothetical protein
MYCDRAEAGLRSVTVTSLPLDASRFAAPTPLLASPITTALEAIYLTFSLTFT